ncbi:nascent polypeptide-associated complex protein [Halosimplex litoreum]|uniref:Nascent polypeptide-associated complex protein n=1 Tax=Halosimplex litoreum TaxID=1198301 RepID=A0A7T3KVS0_9EURY|nr:nascent polypeptide-associated complex protein [Halosimplex litoreum]QPV63429.1 nascent polypeptide-associated complex protein [Halosimplex litoreum]
MFPGGGGMNDRKMQQMMKQMGIDMTDLDAEEVVIRTPDEELVFTDADVQRMDAQGQQTYTIVGEPESHERGEGDGDEPAIAESDDEAGAATIPDEDVELVATRAGASEDDAREALEETNGDLAAAIERLE